MVLHVFSYVDPAASNSPLLAPIAIETALINNQRLRDQHGPMLRVSYSALNELLLLELSGQDFISDHSFVVRPRATYTINDRMKVIVGADFFSGRRDSFFGQLKPNSGFLSEWRYSF